MDDREHRIRERAHELWERAGRPDHRSDEFWAKAEAELQREHANPATAPERKTPTKPATVEAAAKQAPPPVEKPIPGPANPKPKAAAKPKPKK